MFSIHLLHRHGRLLHPGEVMVTSRASRDFTPSPAAIYQKRRLADKEDMANLFGRVYAFTEGFEVVRSEMQDVAPRSATVDLSVFFKDVAEFLISQNLHTILGLQVIDHEIQHDLVELETVDGETLTFRREDIGNDEDWRVTNWVVCRKDGVIILKGNESHASKPGGQHKKFVDGKVV